MSQSFSKQAIKFVSEKRMYIIILILLVTVLAVFYGLRKAPKRTVEKVPEVVTVSTDKPSEEEPVKAGYVWQGKGDEPKRIIIPTINVDGFVQKVAVDQNKQVGVPSNIFLTGWFTESVKPGEKGLSIIDGHLDGYQKDGVFKGLAKLKLGDEFKIERGDGKILQYTVLTVKSVPTDKAASELFSQDPTVESQLNLITCGGTFDKSARSYKERVIVAAELTSS